MNFSRIVEFEPTFKTDSFTRCVSQKLFKILVFLSFEGPARMLTCDGHGARGKREQFGFQFGERLSKFIEPTWMTGGGKSHPKK